MGLVIPATAGEETRQAIREKAKASTYVVAGIMGFHDITPRLHLDMCNWIDRGAKRKLGLVPRDHLKSSVWTIAHSLNLIIRNPNVRILIGNETATNASHFLRRIMAVFERNALFQWLFPELIPDWSKKIGKWSENEMLIPRSEDYTESTIETIGVGGAVVSRHYNYIKLDDLVGKEASESADIMQKTIDWYQYCESLLNSPTETIDLFGTRWAHNDVYSWAEEHETGLDKFFRSIYDDQGEPIWPERFPTEEVERIRKKYGPFKFSCQYLNQPFDPEAGSFVEGWLRYWKWGGVGRRGVDRTVIPEGGSPINVIDLNRFMRVDPAISEKPGAARSAIVVDGVHKDDRKFLLETWAKRCHPFEMINKIFELQEQYDCLSIGIEGVAYQRILKPIIEAEAERRGTWLNIVEFRPDKRESKNNRIRGMQPECERGNIWVNRDMADFLEEYQQFPLGATVDVIDAWAYGPHQWSMPMSSTSEEEEYNEFERSNDHRAVSVVTGY